MLDQLNLDISAYSMKELEDILELQFPYNSNEISEKINSIEINLSQDRNIDLDKKSDIKQFLNKIQQYLTLSLTNLNITTENDKKKRVLDKFSDAPINELVSSGQHFIIQKPTEIEGLNSDPKNGLIADSNGAPPGIINPLNIRTIKRVINIDTRFRPNYYSTTSTDLHIDLPYEVKNVVNMRLSSIEIPTTSYSTSEALGNNRFVVSFNVISESYQTSFKRTENFNSKVHVQLVAYKYNFEVIIPDGNYSKSFSNSLRAEPIEQAINNILITIPELWNPPLCLRYTIDITSGKSIFAQDKLQEGYSPCDLNISFILFGDNKISLNQPLPLLCGWNLGFRLGNYKSPGGEAIVSEGVVLIRGPMYIYLCIDEYANNTNNYFIACYGDTSINNKNILARINLSLIQQYNGIYQMGQDDGYYTQTSRSRNYFGPINISKLKVTLYDEYGRILNLNNMDWSLALLFECIYN